jgi:hypothetical protein
LERAEQGDEGEFLLIAFWRFAQFVEAVFDIPGVAESIVYLRAGDFHTLSTMELRNDNVAVPGGSLYHITENLYYFAATVHRLRELILVSRFESVVMPGTWQSEVLAHFAKSAIISTMSFHVDT